VLSRKSDLPAKQTEVLLFYQIKAVLVPASIRQREEFHERVGFVVTQRFLDLAVRLNRIILAGQKYKVVETDVSANQVSLVCPSFGQ
jgi:hypothetical protein